MPCHLSHRQVPPHACGRGRHRPKSSSTISSALKNRYIRYVWKGACRLAPPSHPAPNLYRCSSSCAPSSARRHANHTDDHQQRHCKSGGNHRPTVQRGEPRRSNTRQGEAQRPRLEARGLPVRLAQQLPVLATRQWLHRPRTTSPLTTASFIRRQPRQMVRHPSQIFDCGRRRHLLQICCGELKQCMQVGLRQQYELVN